MASKSEIATALEAARAAGDAADIAMLEAALAKADEPGALGTGVRHGLQAASLGFSDELRGAGRWLAEKGRPGSYTEGRDAERAYLEASKRAHPAAALAGEVTGTVLPALIPGAGALGAPRGATLVTRALRAVPAGAAVGAAYGAGSAPELSDVPGGMAKGAAAGALAGGAAEAGASVARLATRGARRGLALKAHLAGSVADAAGAPGAASLARQAEQKLLPSPSLSGSKARALARRAEKEGGFTVDVATGESPTAGFAFSKDPANERVLQGLSPRQLRDYVGEVGSALKDPEARLGGWKGDDGWYLDVSRVLPDKKLAMKEARDAGQKAIYDLGRGKEIKTPFPSKKGVEARSNALKRRRTSTTTRTAIAAEAATGD